MDSDNHEIIEQLFPAPDSHKRGYAKPIIYALLIILGVFLTIYVYLMKQQVDHHEQLIKGEIYPVLQDHANAIRAIIGEIEPSPAPITPATP